jgi:hypothetical protein
MAINEVSLFDVSGRCVATQMGNKEISLDVSKLAHGTYFIRLKSGAIDQSMKVVY